MARKKVTDTQPIYTKQPSLVMARKDVEIKLEERIDKGKEIQSTLINNSATLREARDLQDKWVIYNVEYLSRIFDTQEISMSHKSVSGYGGMFINPSLAQQRDSFISGIGKQITDLESLLEKLELIPESVKNEVEALNKMPSKKIDNKSVFIVHGHDENAKINVARFVEKLGLKAIILHEQANKGQTIIEKFEENASNVGFSIVLLTPDDIAAPKGSPESTQLRARQNVILELGYFCGALGRDKVCVLYKEDVEIPSDYLGVIYTPFDDSDGWHLKLAKEMKTAGLSIDLNLIM